MSRPRLLKETLNYGLFSLMAIFIISLLFVPLRHFSVYIGWVITLIILMLVVFIVLELFYFAKDTPKRRLGKQNKEDPRKVFGLKRKTFMTLIEVAGVLILFLIILGFKKGSIGSAECPGSIEGNPDADIRIKYFYSPFCSHCWKEEPVLKELLDAQGAVFSLERYDVRYCGEEARKYRFMGAPAFVFGNKNDNKESRQHGFLSKEELEQIISIDESTGGEG